MSERPRIEMKPETVALFDEHSRAIKKATAGLKGELDHIPLGLRVRIEALLHICDIQQAEIDLLVGLVKANMKVTMATANALGVISETLDTMQKIRAGRPPLVAVPDA